MFFEKIKPTMYKKMDISVKEVASLQKETFSVTEITSLETVLEESGAHVYKEIVMKPLLLRFTEEERKMIEAIKKEKGLSTGSAVIRFLIHQEFKKLSK